MMAEHNKKNGLKGLFVVASLIAVAIAAVVYFFAMHRRRLNREKWKEYDECGLV